jgi:hypothetical protein
VNGFWCMCGRPLGCKRKNEDFDIGRLRSCVRPHMRASPSSYFFIGASFASDALWRIHFLSKAELSSQQGTSPATSHPAGRCPHHGPTFGTGELQGTAAELGVPLTNRVFSRMFSDRGWGRGMDFEVGENRLRE